MSRAPGLHVFVDETKSRDYVMVATAVRPHDVASIRKQVRAPLLPGAERVHFTHERAARRRQLLAAMSRLDVHVTVYVAPTRDHVAGRRACLSAILDDAVAARARLLVLELDESVAAIDRRLIAERLRHEPDPPGYRQLRAKEEPLLWISDAVAWCAQRGGEWRAACASLIVEERRL